MHASRRLGHWLGRLAILLQVGMAGLPFIDAALFHRDPPEAAVHVEAAGVSCHAGDCVLGQTLQSTGAGFLDIASASLLGDVVAGSRFSGSSPTVRLAVGIPVGPRAPPLQA